MRKVLYLGLLIGLSLNMACSDWLDATSETQVEADDLLSNEDGFKDAMIGVYINMGEEDGYGMNYTWYANDLAAFPYATQLGDDYTIWQNHRYTTTLAYSYFEEMWGRSYNIIANVNKILSSLEENRSNLSELSYNLMKGEMLGVRAYVHFDLLRMFGLSHWNGENADKYTVPYVTDFSLEQTEQRTYAETATLLFDDINEALKCLADDPIIGSHDESYYADINLDGFWDDRTKRMNYYAVKALAARAYMWEGSEENLEIAAGHAQDVIDENPTTWVDLEAFATTTDADYKDWTFSTEHLFSLEVMGLLDLIEDWLLVSDVDYQGIKITSDVVENVLFPLTDGESMLPSADDVRYNTLLISVHGGLYYNCWKLYQSSSYSYRNRIPMIKISEMYYIMAEYYIRHGQPEQALAMMDVVREHRGITVDYDPATTDAESELTLEYLREFMGEGQVFYYFKRTGVASPVTSFELTADNLIYRYPQDEVNTGGRHQDM